MADAEAETTNKDKKRKGLFGRRTTEEEEERTRSDTEWVDTLYPAGEGEPVPEGHPLDADHGPEEGAYGDLLDEEPGMSQEPVPHTGWRRRSDETIDEIEYYVDNVLGRPDARAARARRASAHIGAPPRETRFQSTPVEGLGEDVPLALPFPHSELRGARMIYETEGGYVIEVTRAVGGDDENLETQHYTVSRLGEVKHVLDRLRRFESRADAKAALEASTTRHEGHHEAPAATGTPHGVEEPVYEPEFAREPKMPPAPGPAPEPADTDVVDAEQDPPAPDAAAPEQPAEGFPEHDDLPEEDAPSKKKGFLGLGRKKKGDATDPDDLGEAAETTPEEPIVEEDEDAARKRTGFLGFGKKKEQADRPDATAPETEPAPEAEDPSDEKPSKKGFLGLGKKKDKDADADTPDADAEEADRGS